jgi:glycosyltransferase involved in cell wall biosynthesis
MKLSVAMITYNHERFIGQAIESVLAQEVNFDYEIVIGEDCSTDGTRVVVMDFQRRYRERIKLLLRERNIGGFRNIESTLAACQGEYVAILEGDDYWTSPDKLQRQVDFLDAHPDYAVCCHRVRFLNQTGSAEADIFPLLPPGPYTIEALLRGNFVMTCSAVLRRDLSGPLPPCFSKTKVGDWPRYVLAAKHGKIELMDDIMAVYRMHSGSMWSSISRLTRLEECSQMLKNLDKQLGYEYTNAIRQTLCGFYLERASIARQEGKRMRTARHVISCIRNGGWQIRGSHRLLAGLAAYTLIGSWYKVFSRAKSASGS